MGSKERDKEEQETFLAGPVPYQAVFLANDNIFCFRVLKKAVFIPWPQRFCSRVSHQGKKSREGGGDVSPPLLGWSPTN